MFDFLDFSATAEDDGDTPPYYPPLQAGDYAGAIPMLQRAMAMNDAHAMGIFAAMLALGRGIARDQQEAALWFRQAAVRGDIFSQTAFGVCLAIGFGTDANQTEAAFWLYKAGKSGHLAAIEVLSDIALRNQSVIGPHFSREDFLALMRMLRRSRATLH